MRPARHPPREAPTRAQRRDLKICGATVSRPPPCRPWCVTGALTRSNEERSRTGLKLNRSKRARLAEPPELLSQDCRHLAELRQARSDRLRGWRIQWRARCGGFSGGRLVGANPHLLRAQALALAGWRVGGGPPRSTRLWISAGCVVVVEDNEGLLCPESADCHPRVE
jgi:hypothetical protein